MSWAWFKRQRPARLVLGETQWALLSGRGIWEGGAAQDLPQAVERARTALRREKVSGSDEYELWLSARLCPALLLRPPVGLKRGRERQAWLRAMAAQMQPAGQQSAGLGFAKQSDGSLVAASLPQSILDLLLPAVWREVPRLRAVRPLWQAATELPQLRNSALRLLTVYDGEAATQFEFDAADQMVCVNTRTPATQEAAWAWHLRCGAGHALPVEQRYCRWQLPTGAADWSAAWRSEGHQ